MKINALFVTVLLFLMSFSVSAEVINMNKADAATFQYYLKGIGEKKAASIIEYRTENEKFSAIEEIMAVKGIGEGIFAKIKENLSLTEGVITVPSKETTEQSPASNEDAPATATKVSKTETSPATNEENKDISPVAPVEAQPEKSPSMDKENKDI